MNKEKLEYYTIEPNLKQIYGKKVTKDTKFDEQIDDGTVKQHFEDLTLTTTIYKETESNKFKCIEESKITLTVPEGTILIWTEEEGFIVPNIKITTLKDLKEEIMSIEEIYNSEEK